MFATLIRNLLRRPMRQTLPDANDARPMTSPAATHRETRGFRLTLVSLAVIVFAAFSVGHWKLLNFPFHLPKLSSPVTRETKLEADPKVILEALRREGRVQVVSAGAQEGPFLYQDHHRLRHLGPLQQPAQWLSDRVGHNQKLYYWARGRVYVYVDFAQLVTPGQLDPATKTARFRLPAPNDYSVDLEDRPTQLSRSRALGDRMVSVVRDNAIDTAIIRPAAKRHLLTAARRDPHFQELARQSVVEKVTLLANGFGYTHVQVDFDET